MSVTGVNGRKFTGQRIKDAVADSVASRAVELLILEGDVFRTVRLDYAGGAKYLELARRADQPDTLGVILKPVTKE